MLQWYVANLRKRGSNVVRFTGVYTWFASWISLQLGLVLMVSGTRIPVAEHRVDLYGGVIHTQKRL